MFWNSRYDKCCQLLASLVYQVTWCLTSDFSATLALFLPIWIIKVRTIFLFSIIFSFFYYLDIAGVDPLKEMQQSNEDKLEEYCLEEALQTNLFIDSWFKCNVFHSIYRKALYGFGGDHFFLTSWFCQCQQND